MLIFVKSKNVFLQIPESEISFWTHLLVLVVAVSKKIFLLWFIWLNVKVWKKLLNTGTRLFRWMNSERRISSLKFTSPLITTWLIKKFVFLVLPSKKIRMIQENHLPSRFATISYFKELFFIFMTQKPVYNTSSIKLNYTNYGRNNLDLAWSLLKMLRKLFVDQVLF